MNLHLVGIGGEGMRALAEVAILNGLKVTGSEIDRSKELSHLSNLGVEIFYYHAPENVRNADIVIFSAAIKTSHVEVSEAVRIGKKVFKRAQGLNFVLRHLGKSVISISGTNGKGTVTSLLGLILDLNAANPTIIAGAYMKNYSGYVKNSTGSVAVIEACEYDRSFLDIESSSVIVNNIVEEHLDYYTGGIKEIVEAFATFINRRTGGLCVINVDDQQIYRAIKPLINEQRLVTFGANNGEWQLSKLSFDRGWHFDVNYNGSHFSHFRTQLQGKHQIINLLPAIAYAATVNVPLEIIQLGVSNYLGLKRRYETFLLNSDIEMIYDYASHPDSFNMVIDSIKTTRPDNFLIGIFCFRQFHRTTRHYSAFCKILELADFSIVPPITKGLGDESNYSQMLFSEINGHNFTDKIKIVHSDSEVIKEVKRITYKIKRKTTILLIGTGETLGIFTSLINNYNDKNDI